MPPRTGVSLAAKIMAENSLKTRKGESNRAAHSDVTELGWTLNYNTREAKRLQTA